MYYRCYSIVNNTTANRGLYEKSTIKYQNILSNHLNSYICVHKYRENAYNVIIYGHNSCYQCRVAIDKSAVEKGGRFPNTHIEGNRALGKKGIFCAKTMDRMAVKQKGLYDIMNEIKE